MKSLCGFFCHTCRGSNFSDFLKTFLNTEPLHKRGHLYVERMATKEANFCLLLWTPVYKTDLPPLEVYPFP